MRRTSMFAVTLLGLFAICGIAAVADSPMHEAGPYADCAKACGQCAMVCDACTAHCAKMLANSQREHLATLQTCQDCASICGTSACIMARTGPFSADICKTCAEACKKCGEQCEQISNDDMMKHCAEQCRKCEKACRDMQASGGTR